jgi:hypothetical protein
MGDGSVLPSFLRLIKTEPYKSHAELLSQDTSLHVGTVIAMYEPKNNKNFNKKQYEYDVEVMTARGEEIPTSVTYPRCRLQTSFGGMADKCVWAPRIEVKNKDGSVKEPGTQVLIECVNGISRSGIILGAVEPEGAAEQSADFKTGPRLEWQYNGIDIVINKDGELELTRKGATNSKGKVTDKKDEDGATLRMDKAGRVHIETADAKNFVTINMMEGTVSITSDKKVLIETGKIETTASEGVQLGGTEKLIKGDTYVNAELELLQALSTFCAQLTGVATTFSAAILEPALAAGAAQLQAAIPSLVGAIQTFSGHLSSDVLSQKNTTE